MLVTYPPARLLRDLNENLPKDTKGSPVIQGKDHQKRMNIGEIKFCSHKMRRKSSILEPVRKIRTKQERVQSFPFISLDRGKDHLNQSATKKSLEGVLIPIP